MTVYVSADDLKELVGKWRRTSELLYEDSAEVSYVYDDLADELEGIYL